MIMEASLHKYIAVAMLDFYMATQVLIGTIPRYSYTQMEVVTALILQVIQLTR